MAISADICLCGKATFAPEGEERRLGSMTAEALAGRMPQADQAG